MVDTTKPSQADASQPPAPQQQQQQQQQQRPQPQLPNPFIFIALSALVIAFLVAARFSPQQTTTTIPIVNSTDTPQWYNPDVVHNAATPIAQPSTSQLHSSYYNTFRRDTVFNPEFHDVTILTKEKWSPDQPLDSVVNSRTPRVLTDTFVTRWDAFSSTNSSKKWDLNSQEWRDRIAKEITGVYVGETPYFGPLYRVNRPLARAPNMNLTWHNPFGIKKRTSDEFFTKVLNSKDRTSSELTSEFVYYTGGLSTPSLSEDIKIDQIVPESKANHRDTRVNVWVGEKGVVTHAHIDSYDNFFVQVHGTKKFLFISPEYADYLALYPFHHPSYGQTQSHLVNPPDIAYQRKTFPNLDKVKVFEVTLNPGDLVYLPPNWFHQVYTLEPSISVNFWTPSQQQLRYDAGVTLLNQKVVQYWPVEQRRLAAIYLAHFMLNSPTIRQDMKVYRDNTSPTLLDLNQKLTEGAKTNKNQPFFPPSDSDPMNLIQMVQKRYGKAFEYDETGRPKDLGFWRAWVSKNIPYLNNRVKSSQSEDKYVQLFFERYLDTRYAPGFKPHPTNGQVEFTLFNQTVVDQLYQGKTKPTMDFDLAPEYTQKELQALCQFSDNLVIPEYTLAEFFKTDHDETQSHIFYQSKHFQGLVAPSGGPATVNYATPIPHQVYVETLVAITQMVLREFVNIPADQRPIYLGNYIEQLAHWAGSPLGESIPTNIYCFKHANIPMRP